MGLMESTPLERWFPQPLARATAWKMPPTRCRMWTGSPARCMLVRREALVQVGLFDEGYFMYSEELDLCRRLRTAGWRVVHEPRATVVHYEARAADRC